MKHFIFGFLILTLTNSSCSIKSTPTDGIYLIPKGYTGDVIIFFNQPDGIVPEAENGLYVYKIPADGVLRVQTQGVTGRVNKMFYYVDASNRRQQIEYLRVTGDRSLTGEPQNKFGNINQDQYANTIYVMGVGGLGSFNTEKGIIQYTSFIIGTPRESDNLYDRMQKRISNLQRKFIQNN